MQYSDFLLDFALRTYKNLEIIQDSVREKSEGYEVTQLINSMLGLLVFPIEVYLKSIPEEFPNQRLEEVFSKCQSTYESDQSESKSFRNMIEHIRNALAHKHIFLHYDPNEIHSVTFEDSYFSRQNNLTSRFRVTLTVEETSLLATAMCDVVVSIIKQKNQGR
jgi:hypothetical protein